MTEVICSVSRYCHAKNSESGTDHRKGVILDHEDDSAAGGWTGHDVMGADKPVARHAVNCAESRPTQDVAWPSLAGRAGQAFELGESGVADGTTANSLAADRRGPRQDDQVVKTKPLMRSCLRILDQRLGPTRAC